MYVCILALIKSDSPGKGHADYIERPIVYCIIGIELGRVAFAVQAVRQGGAPLWYLGVIS